MSLFTSYSNRKTRDYIPPRNTLIGIVLFVFLLLGFHSFVYADVDAVPSLQGLADIKARPIINGGVGIKKDAAERPNILFIMSDDHAAHAVSCYGSTINETPNLDRLAAEGMRFTNCFCTNALCGPSRAVVLTGRYNHLNGFISNQGARQGFDGSQPTIAKYLQSSGYETAVFGKWHLGSTPTGFDHYEVLIGQGPYFNPPMKTPEGVVRHEGYTTDVITDRTLDWLERRSDTTEDMPPFFVMYHHKAPHANWEPDDAHAAMYEDADIPTPSTFDDDYATRTDAISSHSLMIEDCHARHFQYWKGDPPEGLTPEEFRLWSYQEFIKNYLRVIASVDDNVGRVLDWLDQSGLAESTIVVYTSDQGFFLGDHNLYDKRFMYEAALRMPLLVRWPEQITPGTVSDAMVLNLDFAPTFLSLAGAEPAEEMQGASLTPILFNDQGDVPGDWRRSIYYRFYENGYGVGPMVGVRTERHKLIRFQYGDRGRELFDLQTDPDELLNSYEDPDYADIREELETELLRLQELYEDPEPVL